MKNLRLVFIIFSLLPGAFLFGQYDRSKIDKKAVALFDKASASYQNGNADETVRLLKEAINKDNRFVEAYLSLAAIYHEQKKYQDAITQYEPAFMIDSNFSASYRINYATDQAGLGRFDQALKTIDGLLIRKDLHTRSRESALAKRANFQFAVDYAKTHPNQSYSFLPVNLGDAVNSADAEYFPCLPIDQSQIIFTRRLRGSGEDFFVSHKEANTWSKSASLPGNINTPANEGAMSISQDGKWVVFDACGKPDSYGSCDLYLSTLTTNGWSEPQNLGGAINTDQWEAQPCLSPDKRDLYFASRRPGGFGGSDLYVSHRRDDGRWSLPENLGASVNTPGDEFSPFIHADNQTLYFTSNGLPGYGDHDIFVLRRNTDGKWGKPENLGYPLNTIEHEGTLFITPDGATAYYASDRGDSKGSYDIYSFDLRKDVRPNKTLWARGKVFDVKTKAIVPSFVELIDIASGTVISRTSTDDKGEYLITLPVGKDYAFNVNTKGYLLYSDNYPLRDKPADSVYQKDIPLQPIEVNASVVLRNVFFDTKKYELKPESVAELKKLIVFLNDNPGVKLQIEGHTDNVGTVADNLKLSDARARSVMNYLIEGGVSGKRLLSKGFGAARPVASNNSESGRATNRRTEMRVLAL